MTIEQYVAQVIKVLEETKWILAGKYGSNECKVELGFLTGKGYIYTFSIEYLKNFNSLEMILYSGESFYCKLEYKVKQSRWIGRAIDGNHVQLTPITNLNTWCLIGDARKYMEQPVAEKEEIVLFAEDAYPEYKLQPYDITSLFPDSVEWTPELPAICLIACERLHYFEKTVQALAQNPQFSQWPVYLFLDKPRNIVTSTTSNEHIELMKSYKPNTVIINRPINWGCGKNTLDSRKQLFDTLKHEKVYTFEDDIIVTPNYLSLLENLWAWVEENNYAVGVIQGWNQYSKTAVNESFVELCRCNLWGYSMSKQCWNRIKGFLAKYETTYLYARYNERPHESILKFFASDYKSKENFNSLGDNFPGDSDIELRNFVGRIGTGQEAATLVALHRMHIDRLCTSVSRARSIGRDGTIEQRTYYDTFLQNIVPSYFEGDTFRSEFDEQI